MVVIVGILFALSLMVIYCGLLAWPTMLLFGAVHSFLPVVPAFGFWQTLIILLLLRCLIPTATSVSSD